MDAASFPEPPTNNFGNNNQTLDAVRDAGQTPTMQEPLPQPAPIVYAQSPPAISFALYILISFILLLSILAFVFGLIALIRANSGSSGPIGPPGPTGPPGQVGTSDPPAVYITTPEFTINAASTERYFVLTNTSAGPIIINLPSAVSAGSARYQFFVTSSPGGAKLVVNPGSTDLTPVNPNLPRGVLSFVASDGVSNWATNT